MGYIGNTCRALAVITLFGAPMVLDTNSSRNDEIRSYVEAGAFNELSSYCGGVEALEVADGIIDGVPKFGRKAKRDYIMKGLTEAFSDYTSQEKASEIAEDIVDGIPKVIKPAKPYREVIEERDRVIPGNGPIWDPHQ